MLKPGEVKPQGYEYKSPNFGWIKGEGVGDVVIAYGFPCRVRAIPADRALGEGGAWVPPTPVTDAALVEVRSWIHAVGPVGAMVWVDPQEVLKVAGVRVLGDGMVAVSVEAIRDIEIYIRGKGIVQPTHQEFKDRNFVLDEIRSKLRALRANQGGAEHV